MSMNVSLTPELEALVREKVKSGRFNSANEVVREALRLLQEQDALVQPRHEALMKDIALGVGQMERGESVTYASGDDLAREIQAMGREHSPSQTRRGS